MRGRIDRVVATDFTVLIEGAIGPQPHPNFIEVFGKAAGDDGDREVERATDDAEVSRISRLS